MKKENLMVLLCMTLYSCSVTTTSGGIHKVQTPWNSLGSALDSSKDAFTNLSETASKERLKPEDSYPKASEDATIVYELESNMERTQFFIDAKEMGTARRLKVKINNNEHTVVAKPENCISKEEFIRPPYISHAPLRFTFLIGECKNMKK
jgi:hypothetical protein